MEKSELGNYFCLKQLNWTEGSHCYDLVLQKLQNQDCSEDSLAAAARHRMNKGGRNKLGPCKLGAFDPHPLPLAFTHSLSLVTPHFSWLCLQRIDSSRRLKAFTSHSFFIHPFNETGRGLFSQNFIQLLFLKGKQKRMCGHQVCKKTVEWWFSLNTSYLLKR